MKPLLAGLLLAALLRAADVNTFSIVACDAAAGDWGVAAALADLRQALQLDPNVRRQLETAPGERLKPVSEDKEFLRRLFSAN